MRQKVTGKWQTFNRAYGNTRIFIHEMPIIWGEINI